MQILKDMIMFFYRMQCGHLLCLHSLAITYHLQDFPLLKIGMLVQPSYLFCSGRVDRVTRVAITKGLNFLGFYLQPNSSYRAARLQTSNGFFCSVNHLSGGEVNANHNATHSPSLAHKNKTENDSRLLKNSGRNCNDKWTFCRGQEADIALFLQETIRNIRKIFEENQSTIARNRAIRSNEP